MSEDQLIGIIYSQLLEEFGFGYSEKDLWMIAENIAEKIVNQIPQLNDNQKIVLDWLKSESVLSKESPILAINAFSDRHLLGKLPDEVHTAFKKLDYKQEYEVLALFIQEEGNSKYEL
ncbi:hypothetical protein [Enterococcus hirae]|uniref:hypothetical protein n=1 Tax=Enterococcus hirae TaxID=1354 RepID=UPI001F376ADB|nr:hypothetical protein [Enterococcus hirae]